ADLDSRAFREERLEQQPIGFCFDLDNGLLSLDRDDSVACGEFRVLRHRPTLDDRLSHIGGYFGHTQNLGHRRYLAISVSAAATSAALAIAARSSTLLMLGDASPPVTRWTGESSQSK